MILASIIKLMTFPFRAESNDENPPVAFNSLNEYLARTAIHADDELTEFRQARRRWDEYFLLGQAVASRLLRGCVKPQIPEILQKLSSTLEERYIDELLEALERQQKFASVQQFLGGSIQNFTAADGSPYHMLQREFPKLRDNMGQLLTTMWTRLTEELARVNPIETQRMLARAREEARASGVDEAQARDPAKSHIVEGLERAIAQIQTVYQFVIGRARPDITSRWWINASVVVDEINRHLPASKPAAAAEITN